MPGLPSHWSLIVAGYAARNSYSASRCPVYVATRGELVQTVVASGRVMTPQRVSIASESTGRVVSIPVAEGETVHRGQVLIELDQTDERAAVAQAQAGIAQAEAKLRQLTALALPAAEQSEQQAEANVRQAQQQYQRTKDLVARNFVAQSQLDDAQRNLDVATSQLRSAQLQVASEPPGRKRLRGCQGRARAGQGDPARRGRRSSMRPSFAHRPTEH